MCKEDCNKHGTCIKGECQCSLGFKGDTCNTRFVINGIIGKDDKVICDKGWIGILL